MEARFSKSYDTLQFNPPNNELCTHYMNPLRTIEKKDGGGGDGSGMDDDIKNTPYLSHKELNLF